MKGQIKVFQLCIFILIIPCDVESVKLRSEEFNVENVEPGIKKNNTILIGVLVPYSINNNLNSIYHSGKYYASAMFIALDHINNNKTLLRNYNLELIWGDTKCDVRETLKLMRKFNELGVDVFIGGGCANCEEAAKAAQEHYIPMISYQCNSENVASKYATFLQTSLQFRHLFVDGVKEILHHYNWTKFAVIIEDEIPFNRTLLQLFKIGANITNIVHVPIQSSYTLAYFERLKKEMLSVKENTSIIVVLASRRIMKEILIASKEISMTNGDFVFLLSLFDIPQMLQYFTYPFKLFTADYAKKGNKTFEHFIQRSNFLCRGFQTALVLTVKPDVNKFVSGNYSQFLSEFQSKMKTWFNASVYSERDHNRTYVETIYATQLYDAIYLYANAVHKLLEDRKNYKNGINVRKSFQSVNATSISGFTYHYGENGELQHSLGLYQILEKREYPLTENIVCLKFEMITVGELKFRSKNKSLTLDYKPVSDGRLVWPKPGGLENITDDSPCNSMQVQSPSTATPKGEEKPEDEKDKSPSKSSTVSPAIIGLGVGVVILVGILILILSLYLKKRKKRRAEQLCDDQIQLQEEFQNELI